MRRWKIIADNLKKAGWTLAGFQLWIVTGDQSGLQTRNGEETGDGMLHTSVEDLQKWDETSTQRTLEERIYWPRGRNRSRFKAESSNRRKVYSSEIIGDCTL